MKPCWRGECREGCYYPETCAERPTISHAEEPDHPVYAEPTAERAGDADDVAAMTVEMRQRLIAAAERPLKVRRAVLLLAAHASGHMKHPHGESCETCREKYPCITVLRAASPALRAFEECDVSIADADDLRRVHDALDPTGATP